MFQFSFLRQFPLKWAFWWGLMPNLHVIAMWPVGGPGMSFIILVTGLAALLISLFKSIWLKVAGISLIFLVNVLSYIELSFNMGFIKLFGSLTYVLEMNPLKSPEYAVAGLVILVTYTLSVRYAPRAEPPQSVRQAMLALAGISLLTIADSAVTASTRGTYKMSPPPGTPIDSAVLRAQIGVDRPGARNLVIIMVEALGVPNNAHDRGLFAQTWNSATWSSRYEVTHGETAYFGSTTNGELRELCGVWSDYDRFDFDSANCLPKTFAEAGFRTVAIHNFDASMFDRHSWYPRLGFQDRLFARELRTLKASECGGVFPGACDVDVPRIIGDMLRKGPDQRHLIYWVTLNSHLPVPSDSGLRTENCALSNDPEWNADFPMLCRLYLLHQRLADSLTAEAMRADFPESDILIVGDHAPPFFQRSLRSRFDSDHVPWILLRNRAALDRNGRAKP